MAPYREQLPPAAAPRATEPPRQPRPLRWFWYPPLLMLGPFGLMALAAVARTARTIARDRLAALPFPVTHDREPPTDAWTWPTPLARVTLTLRSAPDGLEAERIGNSAELAEPLVSARVTGATITLVPRRRRGADLVLLADVLCSWGLELHATHGIVGVDVAWRPRTGPLSM
jgi:hypothetical protein